MVDGWRGVLLIALVARFAAIIALLLLAAVTGLSELPCRAVIAR